MNSVLERMRKEALRLGLSKPEADSPYPEGYVGKRVAPKKPEAMDNYATMFRRSSFSPHTRFLSLDYELKDMPKRSIVVFKGDPQVIRTVARTVVKATQNACWHKGGGIVNRDAFSEAENYNLRTPFSSVYQPPDLIVLDDISPKEFSDHMEYFRCLLLGPNPIADWMLLLVPAVGSIPKRIHYMTDYLFDFRWMGNGLHRITCEKNRKWGTRLEDGFVIRIDNGRPKEILSGHPSC